MSFWPCPSLSRATGTTNAGGVGRGHVRPARTLRPPLLAFLFLPATAGYPIPTTPSIGSRVVTGAECGGIRLGWLAGSPISPSLSPSGMPRTSSGGWEWDGAALNGGRRRVRVTSPGKSIFTAQVLGPATPWRDDLA
jgi:hypothetical protein